VRCACAAVTRRSDARQERRDFCAPRVSASHYRTGPHHPPKTALRRRRCAVAARTEKALSGWKRLHFWHQRLVSPLTFTSDAFACVSHSR
jgi:hypothetical protein